MKKILTLFPVLMLALTVSAAPDAVDIRITGNYTFYLDVDDEEGTSDWFFSGKDDTGMYTVRLDWPSDEAGKYGTYTYKDLDRDYSYIKDSSTGEMEYLNYQEGTTFTVSDNNGVLHIEGTLVCDNGVTYNLWMEHCPQTYNIEGTDLTDIYYYSDDTDWYMLFHDDNFRVSLDLNTGSQSRFSGTYTEKDAVEGYNFVTDLNNGGTDFFSTFTVTLSMPKGVTDPAEACEVTGTALTEHGDTYIFHMRKDLPITPVRSVDVDVETSVAEWPSERDGCKSYFILKEKNDMQKQWHLGLNAMLGSIQASGIIDSLTYCIDTVTGRRLRFDNGTVNIIPNLQPAASSLSVSAALVMRDSTEYRFSFDCPVETRGFAHYSFSNLTCNSNYYDELGYQWIYASSDEASIEVTLNGGDIPGEYDDDNCAIAMAVTGDDGLKSAVKSMAVFSASTTLDDHNQPVLKAQFLGDNRRIYNIDAHLDLPAIADTLDVSIGGMKVRDLTQSMGVFQIYGYNADSTVYVALAPETVKLEGHYATKDLTAYRDYSFMALRMENGSYEKMDFYTADFNVARQGQSVSLTGTFQAGTHLVNMILSGTIRPQGLDYDSEDADLDVAFTSDDAISLQKGDGYAYVEVEGKKRSDMFCMLFYLDKYDDDIVIPAGVYDVNTTYSAPSVQPGQPGSSGLYPTFYASEYDGSYIYQPFWFLTKGTVTVTKTAAGFLQFEVNGQNSYQRSVHVTYDGTPTGIGAVIADVATAPAVIKTIENNRIIIRRADRRYTIAGQVLGF